MVKKIIISSLFLLLPAILLEGQEPAFKQKIVIEEVAGTFCKYCPRGIAAMRTMSEKYPDTFIGIVAHARYGDHIDPMWVDAYETGLLEYSDRMPIVVVNRDKSLVGDPSDSEKLYAKALQAECTTAVSVSAAYKDGNRTALQVKVQARFKAPVSGSAYRYAIVVTENGVTGPSPAYDQMNIYADSDVVMGGFEKLPNPVPASQMVYDEVARGIFPGFKGAELSDAAALNTAFDVDDSFDLPDNILNEDSLSIVALLLDASTGQIVNAAQTTVAKNISGVAKVTEEKDVRMYTAPGQLMITADKPAEVKVYSVTGSLQTARHIEAGTTTLPLARGLYIVSAGTQVQKILVR